MSDPILEAQARRLKARLSVRREWENLDHLRTARSYGEYVEDKKKRGDKPLPKADWESLHSPSEGKSKAKGLKSGPKKSRVKALLSKANGAMAKAWTGASTSVHTFMSDPVERKKMAKQMRASVNKNAPKAAKAMREGFYGEMRAIFKETPTILFKLGKERRKPTKSELHTLYGVGVYAAGTALAFSGASPLLAAGKAFGHSITLHATFKAISNVADEVFLGVEAVESGAMGAEAVGLAKGLTPSFGTGDIPGLNHIWDFISNVGSTVSKLGAEGGPKPEGEEEEFLHDLMKKIYTEVGKVYETLDESDMDLIMAHGVGSGGKSAKTFKLEVGDPLFTGKYLNSPGRIEEFGENDKGDPTVTVRKQPKGDRGQGAKKEVKLFKVRFDEEQAERDKQASGQWFIHATRADLARKIMSSGLLLGGFSRKVNQAAVFGLPDKANNRRAAQSWAEAKYPHFQNVGRGGTTLFRFRASQEPDETRRGEAIWYGDLEILRPEVIQTKDEDQLQAEMDEEYRGVSEQKTADMSDAASRALMKMLSEIARRERVAEHVYVVGGAVRNFVIEQPIKDIDVVIDSIAAKRDSEWFANVVAQAIPAKTNVMADQYGVAKVFVLSSWLLAGHDMMDPAQAAVEIANARSESYGGDAGKGYKPDDVTPTTIEEDVYRREFTFNTLMWSLMELAKGPDKAEILDITGCGLQDLKDRRMQCPADPDKTFSDDPSRMLRAIKFIVKYGMKLTPDTEAAIKRNLRKLRSAPMNAVAGILEDTLLKDPSTAKKALPEMKRLGLLDVIADWIRDDKAFLARMEKWVRSKPMLFMFDLMDLGLPLGAQIGFLDRDQQSRLRAVTLGMPEGQPEKFLAVLRQPGKAMDTRALMQEFGLKGKAINEMQRQVAIPLMLANPDLATNARKLTDAIRRQLQKGRTGGEYTEFLRDQMKKRKPKKAAGLKVYLDDERATPPGWKRVYWPDEAIKLLKTGRVSIISLDHDLGDDQRGTGNDVVLWIEKSVVADGFKPPEIRVHSANISARAKMESGIRQIYKLYKRFGKSAGSDLVELHLDIGGGEKLEKIIPSDSLPYLVDGVSAERVAAAYIGQVAGRKMANPQRPGVKLAEAVGRLRGRPKYAVMLDEFAAWGTPLITRPAYGERKAGGSLHKKQFEQARQLSKVDPAIARVMVDSGNHGSDKIGVSKVMAAASTLHPSQTTMVLGKSLGMALLMLRTNKVGGELGALISSDRHIMDGHHRWTAAILAGGSSAKVGGFAAKIPGKDLVKVLNLLTKGTFKVTRGNAGSGDLGDYTASKVKAMLTGFTQNGIAGKFPWPAEQVQEVLKSAFGSVGAGIAIVSKNADLVSKKVPAWAPSRADMPVIDPKHVPKAIKKLQDGDVDWQAPFARAAARYQKKKEVPKADGKGTMTVYEYSDGQVDHRNREKAKRVEKLRGSIDKLRADVTKDLKSSDEQTRLTALAVGLMDHTYERVGNDGSAKDGHFGVTGWQKKHISFSGGKATVKYIGKSGVDQKKTVTDKALVSALKASCNDAADGDCVTGSVSAGDVNKYLKAHDITAKDIRGFHANSEVQTRLKAIRSKGGTLPSDPKKKAEKLKAEFQQALEEAAELVGHKASTLKSQYLVPGMERNYLQSGKVVDNLAKQGAKSARLNGALKRLLQRADEALAVFSWGQAEVDGNSDPADQYGGGVIGYVWRLGQQWWGMAAGTEEVTRRRDQSDAVRSLRHVWRLATKSKGEKDDEEARRLSRPVPTKKPPRKDLRRERVKDEDNEDSKATAENDKDLSLNYKRVARLYQERGDLELLRLARKVDPDGEDHQPGDYWEGKKGWRAWPRGADSATSAKDEAHAKALAEGDDEPPTDEGGERPPGDDGESQGGEPKPDPKADAAKAREKHRVEVKRQAKNFDKSIEALTSSLPPEMAEVILKSIPQKGGAELVEMAEAFGDHIAVLSEAYIDDARGFNKDGMDDANAIFGLFHPTGKAGKDSSALEEFKGGSAEEQGIQLARLQFAKRVVANPAVVGGRGLAGRTDPAALKERGIEAARQYQKASPEIRAEVALQAATALKEMADDDPDRAEMDAIVDGLALGAAVHGESLVVDGERLRPRMSKGHQALAKHLSQDGKLDILLGSVDDFYGPSGRAAVGKALATMDDKDLSQFGSSTNFPQLSKLLLDKNIGPEQKAFIRDFLRRQGVEDLTTTHALIEAVQSEFGADPEKSEAAWRTHMSGHQEFGGWCKRIQAASSAGDDADELSKEYLRWQSKLRLEWLKTMGYDLPAGNPEVARHRHVVETGETSLLDQELVPQK